MICYRDMTFCNHWRDCAKASTCPRPLTDDVVAAANAWWAGFNQPEPEPPIAVFLEQPDCHEAIDGLEDVG